MSLTAAWPGHRLQVLLSLRPRPAAGTQVPCHPHWLVQHQDRRYVRIARMPSCAQGGLQCAQTGRLQLGHHVWKPARLHPYAFQLRSSCIAHQRFVSRERTFLAGRNRRPPLHTGRAAAGRLQTCVATGLGDQACYISLSAATALFLIPVEAVYAAAHDRLV